MKANIMPDGKQNCFYIAICQTINMIDATSNAVINSPVVNFQILKQHQTKMKQ